MKEMSVRRFIVRRGGVRVEITNCFWCGAYEDVCSACSAKADEAERAVLKGRAK